MIHPCPVCGEKDPQYSSEGEQVHCFTCELHGPDGTLYLYRSGTYRFNNEQIKQAAIEAWNRLRWAGEADR